MQAIPGTDRQQETSATGPPNRISQRRWAKNLIGLIANRPDHAVYGAIAVGALLAAESARRETYAKTVVAVVVTLLLYWLAHSYADLGRGAAAIGCATDPRTFPVDDAARRAAADRRGDSIGHTAYLLGVSTKLPDPVIAAVWTSAAIIVTIELRAGLRGRLGPRHLLIHVFLGALLGSLVIVLRALLH